MTAAPKKQPQQRSAHCLTISTTTIAGAGAHVSTGQCRCGWHTEQTYQYQVRAAYRKHLLNK